MKRKIENALRRAVEELPRPDYGTISQAPVRKMEVHDYVTRQKDGPPRHPPRRRLLPGALALCALALCAGLVLYLQFFQVYSVVDLRVNPAFAIQLNRRDQVQRIEALSEDALPFLEGRSYRGWTLEAAVGALLDELAAGGYLSTSEDLVDVAVNSKSAEHGRALRTAVEACIAGKLEGLPAPAAKPPTPTPSPAGTETLPTPTPAVTEPLPIPTPTAAEPISPPSSGHGHGSAGTVEPPAPTLLTKEEVKALVLAQVPEAQFKHVKLEEEHGQSIYEVEFQDGTGEKYEAEFDAFTGEVLKWEED